MDGDFYSTSAQLKRELRGRWRRLERENLLLGTILALAGFYAFHTPGKSQIYDVELPFIAVALHLALLVFTQTAPERTERTGAFFHNLPRDRNTALAADLIYFLAHAFYYELLIVLGIALKLGGADITPIYRLHPDFVALPFAAVLCAVWYCSRPRNALQTFVAVVLFVVFIGVLIFLVVVKPDATIENNYLPSRGVPIIVEWLVAVVLLVTMAVACWQTRRTLYPLGEKRP